MRVEMLSRWIHGLLLFLAALPVLAQQDYEVIAVPDLALGINQRGEITGQSPATFTAFLYRDGSTITLGGAAGIGHAINERSEVAGAFYFVSDRLLAGIFSLSRGWTNIDTFGSLQSEATSINSNGEATGYYVNQGVILSKSPIPNFSASRAFIYVGGLARDLGVPESVGLGINNLGQVTGYRTIDGISHAFLYTNGSIVDLDVGVQGVSGSVGAAINNKGQVTGHVEQGRSNTAFIYENGAMRFLGTLDNFLDFSRASAINDNGEVTGASSTFDGSHAFVYRDGRMLDLNDLDKCSALGHHVILRSGEAIDNRGWIVATGIDLRVPSRSSYLLIPRPPGSACP